MKNQLSTLKNKFFLLIGGLILSTYSLAQDGLDIDVDLDGDDTPSLFNNPLFYVGIAVVLIILALIMRGKK